MHGPRLVTLPSDTSLSTTRAERRTSDAPLGDALATLVAFHLHQDVGELAERWSGQARSVSLLPQADSQHPDHLTDAHELVEALIAGLANDDGVSEDPVGHGMRFGVSAFEGGVSVHHVLKALDLLVAMTLFAMESVLSRTDEVPGATAADGIKLSRRLQRRGALLSLAATRGYMQAYGDALRDRFRQARHDLRNPLGTIKSVLALMDDDGVPLETRANPSFRAIATRNARSLEELIGDRLSDAAALLPSLAGQIVWVRDIVCEVRRELRADAERRRVTIVVEQEGPHGRLDAAGLELLLREVLKATLQECTLDEGVHVDFERASGWAILVVSRESGRPPIQDPGTLARLGALAGQVGATVTAGERTTVVSIQLGPSEMASSAGRERAVPREPDGLSDGEARHDVRGARESQHGQADTL